MATRRTKEPETEIDEDAVKQAMALLTDDTFNAESLNPALESLYAEMGMSDGGEATVHVTKLNADDKGTEAHVWKGAPDDYDLERVAKQFGSGDYRVKLYVRIATGQKVLKGNKVFSWLLSPEEENKRKNPQGVAPTINPMDLSRMVAEAVRAAIPQQTVPQADPITQMRQFAEIMAMMRVDTPAPPQTDPMLIMRNMLEMQAMMRDSLPERDEAPASGNATTNDLLLGLINKFGPMFAQTMMQQGAGAAPALGGMPQPAPEQLPVPSQAPVVAPQPEPAAPTQTEDDVNFRLKMGLNFLIMQCDSGGLPETYAEVVLDSVPAPDLQTIIDAPNAIDVLAQFDKRIAEPKYREWFGLLIAECRAILTEGGEENAPT